MIVPLVSSTSAADVCADAAPAQTHATTTPARRAMSFELSLECLMEHLFDASAIKASAPRVQAGDSRPRPRWPCSAATWEGLHARAPGLPRARLALGPAVCD